MQLNFLQSTLHARQARIQSGRQHLDNVFADIMLYLCSSLGSYMVHRDTTSQCKLSAGHELLVLLSTH